MGELNQDLPDLEDGDHGGYSGRTIEFLDGFDQNLVSRYDPDVVLLMAGTNDTKLDDVPTMLADMRALLTSLTTASPEMQVLVATIPPIDPAGSPASRVAKVDAFNAGLEDLVAELQGDALNVGFVDMRDLTLDHISDVDVDSGLHPNESGYEIIAGHWADALVDLFGAAEEPRVETTTYENGDILTMTYAPDGRVTSETYEDVSDTRWWNVRTHEFAENGQVVRSVLERDNGHVVTREYNEAGTLLRVLVEDVADWRPWDTIEHFLGAERNVISKVQTLDNGDIIEFAFDDSETLRSRTILDGSDRRSWETRTDLFDETGAFVDRTYVYDDGTGLT